MVRQFLTALGALAMLTVAGGAQDGGHLTLGMALEPPHLDPTAGAAAAIDEVVYANVFEGLTRIDRDGTVGPALAERWDISGDGLVYTFTLRRGVTFHDGTAMDAEDVVYSLERAMAPASTNAQKALFEPIASVEAVDDLTARITLGRPFGGLLFNLGWGDAVIVARESARSNKSDPVGTGPFRFVQWIKGDRVELERYEGYWGTPPALARATFKFISDPAAATTAMLAGDVDGFANFPAPEARDTLAADPRFEVVVGTTEGETIMAVNNGVAPFDDARVRRALAHAIDRQLIVDGAMFGLGEPIGSHFAPHHPAYVDLTGIYPYDPEKARELLAEAGYPDGFHVTLKLPPPTYARRGGEIIAAQLAEIGVEVELIAIEWAQWLEQVFKARDYELTIVSHTEPLDIGIYARDDYYFDYHSAEFDAVHDELERTVDEAGRNRLLGKAQRIIAADSVNVFLFQLAKFGVWRTGVEGMWANSPVQANDLTEVRLAE